MFFYPECLVVFFKVYRDVNIHHRIILGQCLVIFVLHVPSCKFFILFDIDIFIDKFIVKVFQPYKSSFPVHQGACLAVLFIDNKRRDAVFSGYLEVVGAEGGGYMHYSGTFLGSDKITRQHLKSFFFGSNPFYQLFIAYAFKYFTFECIKHFERYVPVTFIVIFKPELTYFLREILIQQAFGKYH